MRLPVPAKEECQKQFSVLVLRLRTKWCTDASIGKRITYDSTVRVGSVKVTQPNYGERDSFESLSPPFHCLTLRKNPH